MTPKKKERPIDIFFIVLFLTIIVGITLYNSILYQENTQLKEKLLNCNERIIYLDNCEIVKPNEIINFQLRTNITYMFVESNSPEETKLCEVLK